jgi:hypothetical protein
MAGKTKTVLVGILLFVMSGCANEPVVTVDVYKTPTLTPVVSNTDTATPNLLPTLTPLPSFTPSITPLPITSSATLSPTPSLTPLPDAKDISPVLYASGGGNWFLLLGGIRTNGEWIPVAQLAPYLQGGTPVDFYQANTKTPMALLDWDFSAPCQNYFANPNGQIPSQGVAVLRDWKVAASTIQEIPSDDPVYLQAASDWLQLQGVSPAKVNLTRVMQVDLEGDGVNEVLLNATYYESTLMPVAQAGEYSMVLLRKVSGNDVVTIPIAAEYHWVDSTEATYPSTFTLNHVLDLNQDGMMEIIVGISRWENLGAAVFQVSNGSVKEVLKTIC